MIAHKSRLTRITPPAPGGLGLIRTVDFAKLRNKRLACKACDGKVCVGRCRFEKTH